MEDNRIKTKRDCRTETESGWVGLLDYNDALAFYHNMRILFGEHQTMNQKNEV
jgi:hypothetical protein